MRRKLRRQRATARRDLWLCKHKFVRLKASRLKQFLEATINPSLPGRCVPATNPCYDGADLGRSRCYRMEMWSLREDQWTEIFILRPLRWLMGRWPAAHQQAKNRSIMDAFCMARLPEVQWMEGPEAEIQGPQIQCICQPTEETIPESQGCWQRQGRQVQRQGQECRAASPCKWSLGATDPSTLAQNAEFFRPSIINSTAQSDNGAKSCRAVDAGGGSHGGCAQGCLSRTSIPTRSCVAHLTESLKVWESSLEDYRKHQASLQDMAAKARADIATARQAIERLNAQDDAPGSKLSKPASVEEALVTEDQTDLEEERLRTQLQGVLQACAGSLGVSLQTPLEDVQVVASDADKEELQPGRRQRGLDQVGATIPGTS